MSVCLLINTAGLLIKIPTQLNVKCMNFGLGRIVV